MIGRLTVVVLALVIGGMAVRAYAYVDGSYENGELVDGVAVGPASEACQTDNRCSPPPGKVLCLIEEKDRCVTPEERLLSKLFPNGPPARVASIVGHGEPPPLLPWLAPETNLASHWIVVVTLEDGTRRVYQWSGVGEGYDVREVGPTP